MKKKTFLFISLTAVLAVSTLAFFFSTAKKMDNNNQPGQSFPAASSIQESTPSPTQEPAPSPTQKPTPSPTQEPTPSPTQKPTLSPTQEPTPSPTQPPKTNPAATREKNKDAITITHHYKQNGWIHWITAYAPDKTPIDLPDTTNYISTELSLSATAAYVITRNHDLYIMDKNGCEKITDTVSQAEISNTGDILVYQSGNSLCIYDNNTKTTTEFTSCVSDHANYTISPDGKSIAYQAQDGCRRYINGVENNDPIKGILPMAISDHGEYFYYIDSKTGDFYGTKNNGIPQKLGLIEDASYNFNKDHTQMLYGSENKTWLYNEGKKELISDQYFDGLIFPDTLAKKEHDITVHNPNYDTLVRILDLDHFGHLLCSLGGSLYESGELYYFTDNMKVKYIAPGYQEIAFSEDGNSILYSCNKGLYRIDDLPSSTKSIPLVENLDLYDFKTNADLSEIYFSNEHGDIFYLSLEGPKLVFEYGGIYGRIPFIIPPDNNLYFIVEDNSLFYSKHGATPQKISSYSGPCRLYQVDDILYYECTMDGIPMTYRVKDGKLELME